MRRYAVAEVLQKRAPELVEIEVLGDGELAVTTDPKACVEVAAAIIEGLPMSAALRDIRKYQADNAMMFPNPHRDKEILLKAVEAIGFADRHAAKRHLMLAAAAVIFTALDKIDGKT